MTKSKAARARARAKRVVRQPQARRRASAPRRKNKGGGNRVGVALNYSMVPRTRISGSRLSEDGFQVVSGIEVVSTVVTPGDSASETNSRLNVGLKINPLYPHFQRLSGLAQSYQKFRFRKLHFTYHPACPTTRSGVVSLAYIENPLEGAPDSNPSFASFNCSFTGSIGIPMRTRVENQARDLKWFYTTPFASPSADTDPTAYEQGVVWICCSDAVTADLQLLAGYVSVDYVIEFDDLRPVRDVALAVRPRDTTVTSGAATNVPWVTYEGGLGDFGWSNSNAAIGAPGTSSKENNFWFDEGVKMIGHILGVGATSVALSPREPTGRVVVVQDEDDRGYLASASSAIRRCVYLNGVKLSAIPPGWSHESKIDPCSCSLDGQFLRRCSCSWWQKVGATMVRAPAVAGDLTVITTCVSNIGGSTQVRNVTSSLGTSAATYRDAFLITTAEVDAPCKISVNIDTDGTETRTMEGDDSNMSIVSLDI